MSPGTGVYDNAQTVSITSATAGATIYYTTDGSKPTTSSSVYSAPFAVSTTTTVRAIAVASGKENSREQVAIVNIPITVATIAELYNYLPASGLGLQYYKYTGTATITFIYWASASSTAKKIFLQDNTAGIIIDDNFKVLTGSYANGDNVTGIVGQIQNTNSAPVLYPNSDFTVSSTGNSVTPAVVTLQEVPNHPYQLVQINGLNFDEANGTKKFAINTSMIVHDSIVASTSSIVFNTPNLIAVTPDYIGTVVPAKTNIICLVAKNNPSNTYYYLFPRSSSDLNVQYVTSGINHSTLSQKIYSEKGRIIVDSDKSQTVTIFNQLGQKVKSVKVNQGSNSIEISNGFYLVKTADSVSKIVIN